MKYEEDRNQGMRDALESKIGKAEAEIEAIRDRLSDERDILGRHETTLSRKDVRGEKPGITQERVDKKRDLVTKLTERQQELGYLAQLMRGEVKRLLTFNPVQNSLDNLPSRFRQAEEGEWRIVNSRFKAAQDVLTPPEARILPNRRTRPTRKQYDRYSLDAIPVDPERIPDWFLEEFGLGSLEGLSDLEKLEKKAAITPEVLRIFSRLQPLEAYGRRTYRVMALQHYAKEHDGKVFTFAYTGNQPKEKDRKTIQVFDTAYEAHRRMLHAEQGYEKEQGKLHGIKGRIHGILGEVRGMKKDDPGKEIITDRISTELDILGKVLNYYKAEAADILGRVSDLQDSLGRHNPGASCRQIIKVIDLLEERLPEIFNKSRFVSDDKKILSKTIHQGREVLEQARVASLNLCEALENGASEEEVKRRLSLMPLCDDLKVRPFNQYGDLLRIMPSIMQGLLRAGREDIFRDGAIDMYVACKTFQVQHERERILRDIAASPMETTIEGLLGRARELKKVVESKETFPKVRTGQNEAYNEMRTKIRKLVKGLAHYSKLDLSEAERLAMYERLKSYIEEIDFTEILEKL